MAKWRIKIDDTLPSPQDVPAEYWREITPEDARELDLAEIESLNEAAEADEPIPTQRMRHPLLKAIIALLLVAAFALWSVEQFGSGVDFGFLKRSAELAQDEAMTALRAAVVTVDCAGSSGSGFNISPDGLIVTNRHVVDGGGLITVTFPGGEAYVASNYTALDNVDLAVVKIDGGELPFVTPAAKTAQAGDTVIFIGNPLGYDWTIGSGTVEGTLMLEGSNVILLSGAVHPGSSGSPVFNSQAEVIGVIFATLTDRDNSGLAIPAAYLLDYLQLTEDEHE